ncbi:MAG: aminotransferase class I/II-fold pyridoxal phosphate-dependent enzyme, partial [Clostridiales bacterium]|nr:aminotransferase class I/II-fold pyridoxal phosphate-dependent enzyme [Clostridiales bacterium]
MLSKKARTIKEYAAGEQPGAGYIKLNTNENPYPPGQKTAEVLRGFDAASLRLYPDPDCRGLKEAFARLNEVTPGNIFVGNGSDEVLAFCFPAFYEKDGAPLLMPDVSYSFYPVFCNLFDIPYRRTPVKADFTIDPADYGRDGGQGVVFADPNAPTALGLGLRGIEAILEEFEDKVVI